MLRDPEKLKKEVFILLKRPDNVLYGTGIFPREVMANHRIGYIGQYLYKQTRRLKMEEFVEARMSRRKFARKIGVDEKSIIGLTKKLFTAGELEKIREQQLKASARIVDKEEGTAFGIPGYMKITGEDIEAAGGQEQEAREKLGNLLSLDPGKILEKYPDLLVKRKTKKRKPSPRNVFIGEMMKQGLSMKEASDLWKKSKK